MTSTTTTTHVTKSYEYVYEYHFESTASFWVAEETCRAWGGNLASVHSAEENNQLFDAIIQAGVTEPVYMGLTTHGLGEESWVWTDGTTFSFFDWGNKQPFNYSGGEDCAVF